MSMKPEFPSIKTLPICQCYARNKLCNIGERDLRNYTKRSLSDVGSKLKLIEQFYISCVTCFTFLSSTLKFKG